MGTPCQIDVKLAKVEGRKSTTVKDRSGGTYKAPVFMVSDIRDRGIASDTTDLGRRGRQGPSNDQSQQGQEIRPLGHKGRTHWNHRKPLRQKLELHLLTTCQRP